MRYFYLPLIWLALQSASASATGVSASEFVDLQEGKKLYPTFRRAHAKGFCVAGEFVSNGNLAPFTNTPIFANGSTPITGRFSISGGNPTAADLKAPVRSLALSFNLSSTQQWRIAMNTPPVMAVSNPHDFHEQILAIKKGPDAIKAFFANHPESKDFLDWKSNYSPSASLATETYNSINAFYLTGKDERHAVRWRLAPQGSSSSDALDKNDPNALQHEIASRLHEQDVVFDWVFQFANASDDENNPAIAWPSDRKQVIAGQVVIKSANFATDAACHEINFDPLTLPTGVEATADPILRARSSVYAQSYRRRAKETLLDKGDTHE